MRVSLRSMIRGVERALISACALFLGLAVSQPCGAQLAALTWSAPRGCPDVAYVRQRVGELTSASAALRNLSVRARVQRTGRASFVLSLSLRAKDYQAERRLESTRCSSITDAAIWLVAMSLDPTLSERPSSQVATADEADRSAGKHLDTSTGTAGVAPTATPPPVAPAVVSASAEKAVAAPEAPLVAPLPERSVEYRRPRVSTWGSFPRWWRAGVFGGLWDAQLPAPQGSVGVRAGLGLGVLYTEVRGTAALPRRERFADTSKARFRTEEVGLALCTHWGKRVRGGPCVTSSVLRTVAGSRIAPGALDRALWWVGAGMSIEVGWKPTRAFEIMLETGLQVPVSGRPRYTIEGLGEVVSAAPMAVYARLGFGFRSDDDLVREK